MRVLAVIGLLTVIAIAFGLFVIYTGRADVAATRPHYQLTGWLLETARKQAITREAEQVQLPAGGLPEDTRQGFEHFERNCVFCHGAPGTEPSPVARGLNPEPPGLADVAREWGPEAMYWVIRNGIRMTGMPAWEGSMSEEESWALVAFLQQLPELTPERYRIMRRSLELERSRQESRE